MKFQSDGKTPYEHQEFPKVMFRGNPDAPETKTVHNAEELKALGHEWRESPAEKHQKKDK